MTDAESLIPLSASRSAGARTVEGSGVQGEEDGGIRCIGEYHQRKWRDCYRKRTWDTTP